MNEHDYIRINYLHKELIEIIFKQEYDSEIADIILNTFIKVIAKWREEHEHDI